MSPRTLLIALLLSQALPAQVVINEVLYRTDATNSDPLKTHQWVEIFNKGTAAVDLTGWKVSGDAGANASSARSLPATTVAPGGYLVIHFAAGNNAGTDYFTQDTAPVLNRDVDAVALYAPSGIVDYVAWSSATQPFVAGAAHNDAIAAKIWTPDTSLASDGIQVRVYEKPRRVEAGMAIGRDPDSTDTDTTADFEPHGGVGALGNSPGRRNADTVPVVILDPQTGSAKAQQPRAAPANKKWTVMLYANGDNSLEYYIYGNVQELAFGSSSLIGSKALGPGGSDANVNFVVMYDGKRFTQGAYRGLITAGGDPDKLTLQRALGDNAELGERDMADPNELAGFIAWAKANYPADHYALLLSAHGDGWKGWGPDETSEGAHDFDSLYMGELSKGLAGQYFDVIGFDACLMAGIEVAHQVLGFTDFLLASEQTVPGQGFPYNALTANLKAHPGWTGQQLGQDIISSYAARYTNFTNWTLSLIAEQSLLQLIQQVDSWSTLLRTGVGLYQTKNDPIDNVQTHLKLTRAASLEFHDDNFVDIYDLAQNIQSDGQIPACVKTPISQILNLINGTVVVSQVHSTDLPKAHGVHIYFPRYRKRNPQSFDDYDLPDTRASNGDSRLAIYASNHDQLPLSAADREDGGALNPRTEWPEPPSPGLVFATATGWSRFLERYYHPVSDAHIVKAVSNFGVVYYPTTAGGGACTNASESITVPIGSTIYLSGQGSSDADLDITVQLPPGAGGPTTFTSFSPEFWFWDLDSTQGCKQNCNLEPQTVPPGSPAQNAATNMDADRDLNNTFIDQKDAEGVTTTRLCSTPGTFQVTLMVWDDNHLMPFHRTLPDASYVHPQSDSNQVTITCAVIPEIPTFTTNNPIPLTAILPLSFTVFSDPFQSASYVDLVTDNLTATFSGTQTAADRSLQPHAAPSPTITVKGDRPELVPASGAFNTTTNSFDITGTSTGLIAGFPNVQARYTLSLGSDLKTVTGTYQVGLNSTLNNESQPVTYKVTGTVTGQTYPPPTGPVIVTVNTAGAGSTIAQNDFIEIHGVNLVPATTPAAGVIWSNAPDFAAGKLAVQLSGVSVTVNGKSAFVYFYCSAVTIKVCTSDQINVLTPLDAATGPVQVVVSSNGISSPPFTVNMQATAPSLLQFSPQGYVVATHGDYSLLAPATLYPGASTPAKPGEPIVLYAVGFGLPSTTLVNGASTQSGALSTLPVCTIGGEPLPVAFAGLVGPGLYQLNLTVPEDSTGGLISCSYKGTTTQEGNLLAVTVGN